MVVCFLLLSPSSVSQMEPVEDGSEASPAGVGNARPERVGGSEDEASAGHRWHPGGGNEMKRATGGGRALKKRKEMSDISSTRPSFRAYGWGEGGGLEEGSCGYARCPQVTSELLQVVWLLCFDREPDPRSIMLWHVERGHTPPGELLSRISSSEGLKFYAGVLSPEIVCNWRGFAGDGSAVHCRRGS